MLPQVRGTSVLVKPLLTEILARADNFMPIDLCQSFQNFAKWDLHDEEAAKRLIDVAVDGIAKFQPVDLLCYVIGFSDMRWKRWPGSAD